MRQGSCYRYLHWNGAVGALAAIVSALVAGLAAEAMAEKPLNMAPAGVPLDHVFVKVSKAAFEAISKNKTFVDSNLFFADLNRASPNHVAHYWNGLRSYFEIFDVTQSSQMKFGADESLGIGFLNEDRSRFDALEAKLRAAKPACRVERLKFPHTEYLSCRGQRMGIMIYAFVPDDPQEKVNREQSSAFFRKMYKYAKTPVVDELVRVEAALNEVQRENLASVLTVLGWKKHGSRRWCRDAQCIHVIATRGGEPAPSLRSADFSLAEDVSASAYDFTDLKLQKLTPRQIRITLPVAP